MKHVWLIAVCLVMGAMLALGQDSAEQRNALVKANTLYSGTDGLAFWEAVRAASRDLPYFDVSSSYGEGKFTKIRVNRHGVGFDVIRFRSPPGKRRNILWCYALPPNHNIHYFNIVPAEGTMHVFSAEYYATDRYENVAWSPPWFSVSSCLYNRAIEPDKEYIIWFKLGDDKPVDLYIGINLVHEEPEDNSLLQQYIEDGFGLTRKAELLPEIISISGFTGDMNFAWRVADQHAAYAFKRQVVSRLVQKYNCLVSSRSGCFDIAVEEKIRNLSSIEQPMREQRIVSAGNVVYGDIRKKTAMAGHGQVEGDLWLYNAKNSKSMSTRATFQANSIFNASEKIADSIARKLSLERRFGEREKMNNEALVWTVLPVLRFDIAPDYDQDLQNTFLSNDPDNLAFDIEAALQANSIVDNLVDHKEIISIMNELKMKSMIDPNQMTPNAIARMVGADRMVMGSVLPGDGKTLVVDMHLVDAATSLVLDAVTIECDSVARLAERVTEAALALAKDGGAVGVSWNLLAKQRSFEGDVQSTIAKSFMPDIKTGIISYYKIAVGLDSAESAYLLNQNDDAFVYELAKRLSRMVVISSKGKGDGNYYAHHLKRAAHVANEMLRPIRHSTSTPGPLLLRAEMYVHTGDFEESIRLIRRHLADNPTFRAEDARFFMAECEIKLGNAERAVGAIKQIISTYGSSDELLRLLWRAYRELHDEKGELSTLQEMFKDERKTRRALKSGRREELLRYLVLTRRFEGAEKSYQVFQLIDVQGMHSESACVILLEAVNNLLELGRKHEAARLCDDEIVRARYAGGYVKKFREKLKEIESDIGKLETIWKTSGDMRPSLSGYKIYLVPVGDAEVKFLHSIANKLDGYFGKNVIHVGSPVPVSDYSELTRAHNKTIKYDGALLVKELLKDLRISDDALLIIFLTNSDFVNPDSKIQNIGWYSPNGGSLVLNSYVSRYAADGRPAARGIIECLHYSYADHNADMGYYRTFPLNLKNQCKQPTCVLSLPASHSGQALRFAMCQECQKEYKKVNFDEIHKDLMTYLKKNGAKIVPAEKQ